MSILDGDRLPHSPPMKKFLVLLLAIVAFAGFAGTASADVVGPCYWDHNPYYWHWSPGYQVHYVYSYTAPGDSTTSYYQVYWIADPGYANIRPLYAPCPWP